MRSLFLILLIIPIVYANATSLEQDIVSVLQEIDQAHQDGADVDDLINEVNELVKQLDNCGWENCTLDEQNEIRETLGQIEQEAIARQQPSLMLFLVFPLLIICSLVYLYRKKILLWIKWNQIAYRKIHYEEIDDEK